MSRLSNLQRTLLGGDILVLGMVTLVGFASHNTLSTAGARFWGTFIPLTLGWILLAFHGDVINPARVLDPRQMWRPFYAMILAAPFAGWMRAVWLGTEVDPIFVVVLGGVSALSLLAWRALFLVLYSRKMGSRAS